MARIIQASNLTLGYQKGVDIIKNASFTINSNEIVLITGESGSGKSTLLKSFYGAVSVRSGELSVCLSDLKDASKSSLRELRQRIGIVFQDYRLIKEWTIEQNIALPLVLAGFSKQTCKRQAENLLKHIKLSQKMGRYPYELSGGEQQRIAVARAIAKNPGLILCDEPTGNLDDYSSDKIWELLSSARDSWGACVIVVTHKIPSTQRFAYRHFEIRGGSVHELS
ncbi:MAG: ABC transporter ATP-binding protein [Campylobacter sp.]|nr:ABC transporter ATP-binding protein [Campylobacter sp.]